MTPPTRRTALGLAAAALGQPFVVEERPGAGAPIGTDVARRASVSKLSGVKAGQ